MKRTRDIRIGLVAATAAALIQCGPDHPHYDVHRQCVDQNGVVVDERYCEQGTSAVNHYPYRWYYYSGNGHSFAPYGTRAVGGSFDAPSSGTVRGIFGGTAEGHGFGGAGEGVGE